MMKYKLNIQFFADSTITIAGNGSKVSTTTYTPGGWYYSTNGTSWDDYLCSATTSVSITNNARLRNLADYGAKINAWGSSSSTSTTYNPITLPEYPTKASAVKSSSTSSRPVCLWCGAADVVTGDGWVSGGEIGLLINSNSISTTTTYTNYSANGYYTKQSADTIGSTETAIQKLKSTNTSNTATPYTIMLYATPTAIDEVLKTITVQLKLTVTLSALSSTSSYGGSYTSPFYNLTINNTTDLGDITGEIYNWNVNNAISLTSGVERTLATTTQTFTYSDDGMLDLEVTGYWGTVAGSGGEIMSILSKVNSNADDITANGYVPLKTLLSLYVGFLDISTEDTYTLVGTAGSSYTPTSSSTQLYTLYDESESTTTTDYSAITLPYITRTGYTLEGFYTTLSFTAGTRIGGPGDSYTPTSDYIDIYPKFIANKQIYVKDNNTIKEITSCYQKINGSWVSKTVEEMYTILDDLTYYKDGG